MAVISKLESLSGQHQAQVHASKGRDHDSLIRKSGSVVYDKRDFQRSSQLLEKIMEQIEQVIQHDSGLQLSEALDTLNDDMIAQFEAVTRRITTADPEQNPDQTASFSAPTPLHDRLRQLPALFSDYEAKRGDAGGHGAIASQVSERVSDLIEHAGAFDTIVAAQKGLESVQSFKQIFDTLRAGDGVQRFFDDGQRQSLIADAVFEQYTGFSHRPLDDADALALSRQVSQIFARHKIHISSPSEERHLRAMG